MTEASRFWNTNDVGDGPTGGYEDMLIAKWMKAIFGRSGSGIVTCIGNELAVSGSASPLSVADGAALVDGLFYENDAAVELTVTTPSVGITGGRVILRADWSAQTVRAAVLLNTDGVADIPDLTQTSGTTYEISLATFKIETDGDIINLTVETGRVSFADSARASRINLAGVSVLGNDGNSVGAGEAISAASDGQVLRRSGTAIGFGQIDEDGMADNAVTGVKLAAEVETAQITDGAVDTVNLAADAIDDTKVGERVPQFYRRKGGSASNWDSPGANDYTPSAVRMIAGVTTLTATTETGVSTNITLPVSLFHPLLYVTIQDFHDGSWVYGYTFAYGEVVDDNTIKITVVLGNDTNSSKNIVVAWLAIGPEA